MGFDVSDKYAAALIAASVSIVVALLSFAATLIQLKSNRKKLEREFAQDFSQKIYEHRIRLYPAGYALLSRVRKVGAPHFLPREDRMKEIKDALNAWAGEASLFFSRDTQRAYWELREALGKRPAHGSDYSEEQAEKVWQARNALRRHMRGDIGNLYAQDENAEPDAYWEHM